MQNYKRVAHSNQSSSHLCSLQGCFDGQMFVVKIALDNTKKEKNIVDVPFFLMLMPKKEKNPLFNYLFINLFWFSSSPSFQKKHQNFRRLKEIPHPLLETPHDIYIARKFPYRS